MNSIKWKKIIKTKNENVLKSLKFKFVVIYVLGDISFIRAGVTSVL